LSFRRIRSAPSLLVANEAHAAAYADRVVFLADGKIVRELRNPTEETVLETIKDVSA